MTLPAMVYVVGDPETSLQPGLWGGGSAQGVSPMPMPLLCQLL